MAKKGNGNGKGSYWRNRIKSEQNKNKRFRGRLRAKGKNNYKTNKTSSKGPSRGGWATRIKSERGQSSKSWSAKVKSTMNRSQSSKKLPKKDLAMMKSNIQIARRRAQIKGKQFANMPSIQRRPPTVSKSTTATSRKFSKQNPKLQKSVKQRANVAKLQKSPSPKPPTQAKGMNSLKKAISKPAANKAANSSPKAPNKGTYLLKQKSNAIKNLSQGKPRVKAPVIRRGK